ncbi:MAG TPA: hypothetical protein VLU92_14665 [Candidatus Dormibacteraeota bacterium]|nr:hypothetical protein [Candidatus Dormibacteraeota bacterium]
MLEFLVAVVVGLLVVAGIVVMIGPNLRIALRRVRALAIPTRVPSVFQSPNREMAAPGLNPKTQRVLVAVARLAAWLRAHGQEDLSRELRNAAARLAGNEPAGLYALQTSLRKLRVVNVDERAEQERLKALANELRVAVQDRFEQLELLPFKRP